MKTLSFIDMHFFHKVYEKMENIYYCALTVISPRINTIARYKHYYGKRPDLQIPRTFVEKLLWLKLNRYIDDPLVIQCADKYAVRQYIESCGCADILNKLYGVYDDADCIPWDKLPDGFVIKWNFGAGKTIICHDKKTFDISKAEKQLKRWKYNKYWLPFSEMQYKKAKKKIICEMLLEDPSAKVIPDYKVYCFHGEPKAILVMHDRGDVIKSEFFDERWEQLENTEKYRSPDQRTEKPCCLEQMLSVCRKISTPFPFVRCDFYIIDSKLFFGEMTFTPAGGLCPAQTTIHGKDMTDYLQVP